MIRSALSAENPAEYLHGDGRVNSESALKRCYSLQTVALATYLFLFTTNIGYSIHLSISDKLTPLTHFMWQIWFFNVLFLNGCAIIGLGSIVEAKERLEDEELEGSW